MGVTVLVSALQARSFVDIARPSLCIAFHQNFNRSDECSVCEISALLCRLSFLRGYKVSYDLAVLADINKWIWDSKTSLDLLTATGACSEHILDILSQHDEAS